MAEKFVEMLRGNTNTLGRTAEVVEAVNKQPIRINELFDLYFQDDEWVRLRVSSALKRLWRQDKDVIRPFLARWIDEVALIDQPSTNWTFAQMVEECADLLSKKQLAAAVNHIKRYLKDSGDWIVINSSIQCLAGLAQNDKQLAAWLKPHLQKHANSSKKSIAGRAKKALKSLS